jgi:N-acetylglucosamine-6-phosphate deacetylase
MKSTATPQVSGRHYRTGRAVQLDLAEGRISSVHELALDPAESSTLPWLSPGFVDVQSNGYGGQEFSALDLTPDKVAEITTAQAAFGVTQYCPTVTTASRETITHALGTIVGACRRWPEVDYAVAGIHVEGPYLSPEDGPRGAHPLEHCRPPDWEEFCTFQDAAQGRIRIVTLAVEYAQSVAFIERAVASGVVVAIGHTSADSRQIRAAVDAGASLSTHLGNGAHRALRRHPNYLWDQLAEDRLTASLIVDGHHLPPEVVQTFVRAKTPQRCILVSDLSGLAGLPPGRYATALCDLEILADGRLVIAGQDQLLAGASAPIGQGVVNVMRFAGVDLATAVDMASNRPAQLLGRPAHDLQPDDAANLTLFDIEPSTPPDRDRLVVHTTISRGNVVYTRAN